MVTELWQPRGIDKLFCPTHAAEFEKGDTCSTCMQGFARDSSDATVQRLEKELASADRSLDSNLGALLAEAKACQRLRRRICTGTGPKKVKRGQPKPKKLKVGEVLAASTASKAAVTAYREAIAETRRRREDLEAELYRALERQTTERGGAKH